MATDDVTLILNRWQQMKTARTNWDTLWQEVADYCCPRKGNILTQNSPGQQHGRTIYDSTAIDAGLVSAAGLVSNIFPAGEKWSRLDPKNKDAPQDEKDWWAKASDKLVDVMYDSNFYETAHECMIDAIYFNTTCLLTDEDDDTMVNFTSCPVGTFAIEENHRGRVDVVGREWKWTARQAEQKWGAEKLGKMCAKALTTPGEQSKEFTFVHFVEPRKNADKGPNAIGSKRPYRSIYLCVEDKCMVGDEGGYYRLPYAVNRLLRSNGELYGRGPGTDKLSDVKMLNAMMRDYLLACEKQVKPNWLMTEDQPNDPDNSPNGVTYWDASGGEVAKPEILKQGGDLRLADAMIKEIQNKVKEGYFVPLFQMLTAYQEQRREKTAYEVEQMVKEQMNLFSPLFGRMTRELLNPIIERVFDIMCRRSYAEWSQGVDGFLPIPPDSMRQAGAWEYNVTYISKIALAVKLAENQAFSTMLAVLMQTTPLDPNLVHLLDIEGAVRDVARNVGFPARYVRSSSEYQGKVKAAMEAQQAATAPQQAMASTKAIQQLGPLAQQQAARKILAGQSKAA